MINKLKNNNRDKYLKHTNNNKNNQRSRQIQNKNKTKQKNYLFFFEKIIK